MLLNKTKWNKKSKVKSVTGSKQPKVWFEMKSTLYIEFTKGAHGLRPHMWPVRTCVRTYARNSKPIWKALYVEWSLEKDPSRNVNFKLWNYPLLNVLFISNQTLFEKMSQSWYIEMHLSYLTHNDDPDLNSASSKIRLFMMYHFGLENASNLGPFQNFLEFPDTW